MSAIDVTLSAASAGELPQLYQLLQTHELPVPGTEEEVHFLLARVGGQIAGFGGLEYFGYTALLRSVLVLPGRRGLQIGEQLVRALEQQAWRQGVRQIGLLTETAAPFFTRLGYETVSREALAAPLQQSKEFQSVCPVTARAMHKELTTPKSTS